MTTALYFESAECRIPADLGLIEECQTRLRDYCLARGLRPAEWSQIELATAEALANAIKHGCAGKEGAEVILRWHWQGREIVLEITDPGDYVPEPGWNELPEDPFTESGRGGFLMTEMMDRAEHERTAEGHRIRLAKTVGEPAWQTGEVAQMESTIESMAEDLSRSYEELSALFRFAEQMATSSGFEDFLARSLERLLKLVRGHLAYIRLQPAGEPALRLVQPQTIGELNFPENLPLETVAVECGVFHKHDPLTVEDCTKLPASDPLQRWGGGAFVCPIFFQTTVLGCLVVTLKPFAPYFSAGELSLIRCVADFLGIVRTTSLLQGRREAEQRVLRELEIAASIQASLLPERFPIHENYRMHGVCVSAQQVGGDYFEALAVGDGGVLLVMADVMGKGVPAALLATVLRTAIHARLHLASDPAKLLTEVNGQISDDLERVEMFITAQVAYLSPGTPRLLLANAGHCPMFVCQGNGLPAMESSGGGIPIGIVPDFSYEAQEFSLKKGDRIVFLTDGLFEVHRANGEMLGMNRLKAQATSLAALDNPEFCIEMLDYVRQFSGDSPATDDRTLLAVQILR